MLDTTSYVDKLPSKLNEVLKTFTGSECIMVRKIKDNDKTKIKIKQSAGNCHLNVKTYIDNVVAAGVGVTSVNGQTGVVVINKTDIGLGNIDNTSDADKPVSTAVQTALNDKVSKTGDTMSGELAITNQNSTAVTANNFKLGNPWGAGNSVLTVADGVQEDMYIQSADQLGAFAGIASRQLIVTSGYTENASSGSMRMFSGTVISGEGSSGNVEVKSGNPSGNGSSGRIDIFSSTSNGASGYLYFRSGSATGASGSGLFVLETGAATGTGNSGFARLASGSANTGISGNVDIFSGDSSSNATGVVFVSTGKVLSGNATTGNLLLFSGRHDSTTGGNTGTVILGSGRILNSTSTGSTGTTRIQSGNVQGSGNSGAIEIETGTITSGTRGDVRVKAQNIWLSGANNFGMLQANDGGVYTRNELMAFSLDYSTFFHADYKNTQYPSVWITGGSHDITKFAQIGAFGATGTSAGAVAFKGANVQGTIDGTYSGGDVYLESNSASYSNDTAANLSINSGKIVVQSSSAFIKGSSTAANSGNVELRTGAAAGTGNRGSVVIDAPQLSMQGNSITNTSHMYFGDPNTDGTYRIRPDGANLITERRESGVWITKQTITP
jgi:hypothetical protein